MTAEIETGRLRPPPVATAASRPPPPVRETLAAVGHAEPVRRRRFLSPLTRRILLLNALAIAIPVVGLLYLDAYRNSLNESELKSLRIEGELFAGALGSTGVTGDLGEEELGPEFARKTVRRLVEASKNRARVFLPDGSLTARGKTIVAHTPAGRFGVPEELISTFIWLCGPGAAFINGVVIPVDGGFAITSGV